MIYLVISAGGNTPTTLSNRTILDLAGVESQAWLEDPTLAIADVDGTTLNVRQVSVNGEELDRFTVAN